MTDYLEPLLDNTSALLERVRRLEESGGALKKAVEDTPAPSPERGETGQNRTDRQAEGAAAEEAESGGGPVPKGAEAGASAGMGWRSMGDEAAAPKAEWPLLDRLKGLEWAQAALEGGGAIPAGHAALGRNGTAGYPRSLDGPGRRWAEAESLSGWSQDWEGGQRRDAPSGEALDWAEQADRIFRRDSRRYDGGFSLY